MSRSSVLPVVKRTSPQRGFPCVGLPSPTGVSSVGVGFRGSQGTARPFHGVKHGPAGAGSVLDGVLADVRADMALVLRKGRVVQCAPVPR